MADNANISAQAEPVAQTPEREITVADALQYAVSSHRAGALDEAEKIYREVLKLIPEQPDALNFLAMIEMHNGKLDIAIELMERSLKADPDHGERYNNLGNLLLAAERVPEATAAYEEAIVRCPETAAGYNNIGVVYRAQGRVADAEKAYRRAVEIDPNHAEAWNNYGTLCSSLGQHALALKHYSKALTLRPGDKTTGRMLALAYVTVGDLAAAAEIYRKALEKHPGDPGILHLIAALTGEGVPARATDDFIVSTFDGFADSFDRKLAHLEYRAPQLIVAAVGKAGFAADKSAAVLDVGCGTGLCGPLVAPYAASLCGVDLSEGMLQRARMRAVYDTLVKEELTAFLRGRSAEYDLIVSADTLCYFGALDEAIGAAARALRPGGCLVFTVEQAEDAQAPAGHRINPHGRYSHTRDYVDQTLAAAGFTHRNIAFDVLRQEAGEPVKGLVVTARLPAPNVVE